MRKWTTLPTLAAVIALLFGTACGREGSEKPTASTESARGTRALPPRPTVDPAKAVGEWRPKFREQDVARLEAARKAGDDLPDPPRLVVREDGTFRIGDGPDRTEGRWEVVEGKLVFRARRVFVAGKETMVVPRGLRGELVSPDELVFAGIRYERVP